MHVRTAPGKQITLEGDEALVLDLELERTEPDGRKVYRMKGVAHAQRGVLPGLPAQLFAPFSFRSLPPPTPEGEAPSERAKGSDGAVEGIASSTSVDWYGTEMDRDALDGMALQFTTGVSLTPRHNGWFDPVEWDEVIGITEEGLVKAASVEAPADGGEQGYVLSIRAKLFPEEEKAMALQRRLSAGQPIGLSIGGWFTDVRFISNEEGEVERVIILSVKLDHLAVTRAPANPDSMGLKLMRSMGTAAVKALRVASTTPLVLDDARAHAPAVQPTEPPETRAAPVAPPASIVEPVITEPSAEERAVEPASPVTGKPSANVAPLASPDDSTTTRSEEAPSTPTEEDSMTPEALRALLAEALTPITARLDAVEAARSAAPAPAAAPVATPAPAPVAVDRTALLEAEVSTLRARVADLAGRPTQGRRAMVPDHAYRTGDGEGSEFRSMVQLARTEGKAVAIASVSERHAKALTADRYDGTITRSHLESCLRDMIQGAISDGIIRDPSEDAAWG
jgi:hypothetical protein